MPRDDQPSDHGNRPILPHPVVDTPGLDKLEGSLNDLSKAAATQSLTYLLLWLYLIFTVTAVTDYDLLVEKPIKLPIFDLEVGLLKFFIGAPALFWLVQLYMVRKVSVIADAVRHYLTVAEREAAKHTASPGAVLEALRHRVDGFVVTRLLARFDTVRCGDAGGPATPPLPQALTVLAAAVTLVLAPVLLYGAFQIRFLAYQHEWITWWHRVSLFAGLALSAAAAREAGLTWAGTARAMRDLGTGLFGGLLRRRAERRRAEGEQWPDRLSRRLAASAVPAVVAASLVVATTPGEFLSDEVVIEGRPLGDLLAEGVVPRSLKPRPPNAHLATALPANNTAENVEAGPPPLDISHRDFSGRRLRKVDLSGAVLNRTILRNADLRGAFLLNVQLQGANFFRAQLQGAYLSRTQLQGAYLFQAQLQGANLFNAHLQGANLFGAQLQGANFYGAQLQGANLSSAQLQGADLPYAQLQGVDLFGAQLQGADLFSAQLQGANLSEAQLQGAYLPYAQLQGADLSGAQLQGAVLWRTAVWKANMESATFENVLPAKISESLDINDLSDYAADIPHWLQGIPTGHQKLNAAKRLERLLDTGNTHQKDMADARAFRDRLMAAATVTTPESYTRFLILLACKSSDGAHILASLLRQNFVLDAIPGYRDYLLIQPLVNAVNDPETCPPASTLDQFVRQRFLHAARQRENSEQRPE
ncbi:pentapeptide repeat-containing protein [Azospirillum himalayense]|uniref:Pentapeptide repeat-containing protein n=1 Tax=Azospirillum himalayense TaxID=654847 RepID=A0ABW0G1B0_9PROT